ncbi:hypothetical protein [Crenalkalicoccus roseus]|uniref:hypothetical protein n=1 Tax=Crenalkalicoccus roseus TaxID=1485588 RepID=UPI00108216F1|nr:hypothetical protein [Crenalkalicoccus roseus]
MPIPPALPPQGPPSPRSAGTASPAPATTEMAETAASAAALPNPTLRLEPSLGLVVLEFRDARGEARTIPSERELEAYRTAARASTPAPDQASSPPAGKPGSTAAPPPQGEAEAPAASR